MRRTEIVRVGLLAVALMMGLAMAAYAVQEDYETVRVTPDDMHGWSFAVHSSTELNTCPAAGGFVDIPGMIPPPPRPSGCFYADLGRYFDGGVDCGRVCLGTNAYSGYKITDIIKMEYQTYNRLTFYDPLRWPLPKGPGNWKADTAEGWDGNSGDPHDPSLLGHYVSQPFQVQLACRKFGGTSEWRWLMYRPWGIIGSSHKGEDQRPSHYNSWKIYDAGNTGTIDKWTAVPSTGPFTGSWAALQAYYSDATLDAPPAGWGWMTNQDSPESPTGTSLMLMAGSHKGTDPYNYFQGWWQEGYGFFGYVDYITIGVVLQRDGQGNPSHVKYTTYDFELGPEKQTVFACKIKSLYDSVIYDTSTGAQAYTQYRFKACGAVIFDYFDMINGYFAIDDGSGEIVEVYAPKFGDAIEDGGLEITEGDIVSAVGTLRVYGYPRIIITSDLHKDVLKLHEPL